MSLETILGIETHLGEGVIKEEKFTQIKKHSLICVSRGRNRTRGKRAKTQIMQINKITSQEVVQMLLSTILHGAWEGGL